MSPAYSEKFGRSWMVLTLSATTPWVNKGIMAYLLSLGGHTLFTPFLRVMKLSSSFSTQLFHNQGGSPS